MSAAAGPQGSGPDSSRDFLRELVITLVSTLIATLVTAFLAQLGNPLVIVPIIILLGAGISYGKRIMKRGSGRLLVLLAVVAASGVAVGLLISWFVPLKRSPVPPPTPVVIQISTPTKTVSCPNKDPACRFEIAGKVTRMGSNLRIYTFVFPVEPPGGGWYLQLPPATVAGDGTWVQSPALVGYEEAPARSGDVVRVRAVVVHRDASYKGTLLSERRIGEPIPTLEDIEGIAALSEPVQLNLKR